MRKNRRPEVISEIGSEHPGSLWLVGNDGVFRLDAGAPDANS
jgi:hypothetical protein